MDRDKFKDHILEMGYYQASVTELMTGFKHGKEQCLKCNQERTLFTLNPVGNTEIKWICIECLKNGDYTFGHDTELGFVTKELPPDGVDIKLAMDYVSDVALQRMLKTPPHQSIQGGKWLCHCNDFMIYKGIWNAPDFTKASPDGN